MPELVVSRAVRRHVARSAWRSAWSCTGRRDWGCWIALGGGSWGAQRLSWASAVVPGLVPTSMLQTIVKAAPAQLRVARWSDARPALSRGSRCWVLQFDRLFERRLTTLSVTRHAVGRGLSAPLRNVHRRDGRATALPSICAIC